MDDDYYSIEAILAENQKIQCAFKADLPDLGHLAGGNERDIKALSKIPLPLWLSYTMIFSDWADFTVPAPFHQRVRNALNAEATSVRLAQLVGAGGTWYGFGRNLMGLLTEEGAEELSRILTKTFKERVVEVIDQAQHFAVLGPAGAGGGGSSGGGGSAGGDSAQMFREGLDVTERELFMLAQESARRTKMWYEMSDKGRR